MLFSQTQFIRLECTDKAFVLGDPETGEVTVMLGKRIGASGAYHGLVPAPEFIGMFFGSVPGALNSHRSEVRDGREIDVYCPRSYVKKDKLHHVERGLRIAGGQIFTDVTFFEQDDEETAGDQTGLVSLRVQLDRGPTESRFSKRLSDRQCWEIIHSCHEMGMRLARIRADDVHAPAQEPIAPKPVTLAPAAAHQLPVDGGVLARIPDTDTIIPFPSRIGELPRIVHGLAAIVNLADAAE